MLIKIAVVLCFAGVFALAIRKNRIYIVPCILLFYSNINGLLDWEDFAMKGLVKFQDYGLLITLAFMLTYAFSLRQSEPDYMSVARKTMLYNMINVFWLYYTALLFFSVFIQGGPIWPIKMGRTFFYGLLIYVIYQEVMDDPVAKFERILRFLMWATLFFGVLYIIYNLTGLPIYPKGEYESFNLGSLDGEVKRNFSGFPTFAYFFIFYLTDRLLRGEGNPILNLGGLAILALCIVLMLTRGTLILTALLTLFVILYRRPSPKMLGRLGLAAIVIALLIPLVMVFTESYYLAMMRRFDEFAVKGFLTSHNSMVRVIEFERILKNVWDFDPLFGFGFTNVWGFGYTSSVIHGGSADNGYSNLLGTTGFVGLLLFLTLIFSWLVVNLRLQALRVEHISRVNFGFILFVLGAMMNNAHIGYFHFFAIFMAYDLFAYAYFKHNMNQTSNIAKRHLGYQRA